MKIVTVVGARPQFIKAAAVSRLLRQKAQEVLVHTGQHHDYNMSGIFFTQLGIPEPDYNLGISGGTHGQMTGRMLMAIEEVLLKEQPDKLLVYGDTNSTLAAALAAVKLGIPVCHVEAGNRLKTLSNPEEINRICTDHVATQLLACTESALAYLREEGLRDRATLVGDPMYDAFLYYGNRLTGEELAEIVDFAGAKVTLPPAWYYLTCHRQENTDTDAKLTQILLAMETLDLPTVYPVHPRNRERAQRIYEQYNLHNIILTQPVGYLTSIALIKGAKKVVTDSGGLQREAFFAEKQCVTVFDYVGWPETMVDKRNVLARLTTFVEGRNQVALPVAQDILDKLAQEQHVDPSYQPFGDGHAGEKIVRELLR